MRKKTTLFMFLWVLSGSVLFAENHGAGFSMSLGEKAGDFSLGADVLSPSLFNGLLVFRVGGECLWKAALDNASIEQKTRSRVANG